jgi:hypothetical protein
LLLLSHSKNSELQNKCFSHKKIHKNSKNDDSGYFNGSYSEIAVSTYPEWTPTEILNRGSKMLDFIEKRWAFDISDWGIEKNDLLGLTFELN